MSQKNLPMELVNLILDFAWIHIKDIRIRINKIYYDKINTVSESIWYRDHLRERLENLEGKKVTLVKKSRSSGRGWIYYIVTEDNKYIFVPEHLVEIEYII